MKIYAKVVFKNETSKFFTKKETLCNLIQRGLTPSILTITDDISVIIFNFFYVRSFWFEGKQITKHNLNHFLILCRGDVIRKLILPV